jgi:uncharacterized protein (DUF924 family)
VKRGTRQNVETLFKDSGRFPHQKRALGRDTTPAERAFLEADGFGRSNEGS